MITLRRAAHRGAHCKIEKRPEANGRDSGDKFNYRLAVSLQLMSAAAFAPERAGAARRAAGSRDRTATGRLGRRVGSSQGVAARDDEQDCELLTLRCQRGLSPSHVNGS